MLQAITLNKYEDMKKSAIKVHIPLGNEQPNDTNHPIPPIAETIEMKDGTLVSRFNLSACKKHPVWTKLYKPAGIGANTLYGIWAH